MPAGSELISEKGYRTVCNSHCGGVCVLKVYVRNGTITRIETDDNGEPQFRACLRGRAYRQRVYDPARLKYPLKRTGPRGEGKFERISWDEALDTIAREIGRIRASYGPAAIIYKGSGGDLGLLSSINTGHRFFNLSGGCSETWGTFSYEGCIFACLATYGTLFTANTRDDLRNSKLIIMWGWDPANSIQDTNTQWHLQRAKEAGARFVSVDPRYTDSAAATASRWIPIRPGTDAAMLISMAYVIISENLQSQSFLDSYTTGFPEFHRYLLGVEDKTPKTPVWAENITGVPAETIAALAREYATQKPAALIAGIAPGRTAYGEQFHRAAMALCAMTGNIGVTGGNAAGRSWGVLFDKWSFRKVSNAWSVGANPVEEAPHGEGAFAQPVFGFFRRGKINVSEIADAILKGKAGGYPADYKMLYLVNTNPLTQYPNANKMAKAFQKLEFLVTHEQLMTPTAKFADIVLPTSTMLEHNDITVGCDPFYAYMRKCIEPLHETKSNFEIFALLARRMNIPFTDKSEEDWLKVIADGSGINDYREFKDSAVVRIPLSKPYVAFQEQIEEPEKSPFPTPSGKIELLSKRLADMNDPSIPAVPEYIETWESVNDPLAAKYPLQLVTTHLRRRAHSQFDTLPWLREVQRQEMLMNSADARTRGIKDGSEVRVFNDRGTVVIRVKVTERIMPGVVDIPQGAWYTPDKDGVDRGGCCNVLTRDRRSPGGALSSNTCLVQVEAI